MVGWYVTPAHDQQTGALHSDISFQEHVFKIGPLKANDNHPVNQSRTCTHESHHQGCRKCSSHFDLCSSTLYEGGFTAQVRRMQLWFRPERESSTVGASPYQSSQLSARKGVCQMLPPWSRLWLEVRDFWVLNCWNLWAFAVFWRNDIWSWVGARNHELVQLKFSKTTGRLDNSSFSIKGSTIWIILCQDMSCLNKGVFLDLKVSA